MKCLSTTAQFPATASIVSVFGHQVTTDFLHPDGMLPAQFFTAAQESHSTWTGERLLMLAVLQDAVHTYFRYCASQTRRGRRLFAEVQAWFSSDDRHYLYSFASICEHLHLDPNYLRRGIVQRAAGITGRPKPVRTVSRWAPTSNKRALLANAA